MSRSPVPTFNRAVACQTHSDQAEIRRGAANAQCGSTVLISEGSYTVSEPFDFYAKDVTLRCDHGVAHIHGEGCTPIVLFGPGEDYPKLCGITLSTSLGKTKGSCYDWYHEDEWNYGGWSTKAKDSGVVQTFFWNVSDGAGGHALVLARSQVQVDEFLTDQS
jgi:hypothetical protein